MKLLLYEYASGGGFAGQSIPAGILCEGYGMLRSVATDFKAAGHEVTALIDARLSRLNPPIDADQTVTVRYPQEPLRFLSALSKINDATYVIAPETGMTLQSLVSFCEQTGKVSLNCQSTAIAAVSDKAAHYEQLEKAKLSAPKSIVINANSSLKKITQAIKEELTFPIVLKPAEGIACSGLSLIKKEIQLEQAAAKIKAEAESVRFVAQQFIDGEDASVSVISTGKKAVAVSLNKQNITLSGPETSSSYEGGVVPLEHPMKAKAFALAERTVELISGLQGYVGVDLVLTQTEAFVVDVNARLTTSYVGFRQVAGINVADAMVKAVTQGQLPSNMQNGRFACFSKVETPKPTIDAFKKAAEMPSVISPPFPLNPNNNSCSLMLGVGESLEQANLGLEEAKKQLKNTIS